MTCRVRSEWEELTNIDVLPSTVGAASKGQVWSEITRRTTNAESILQGNLVDHVL